MIERLTSNDLVDLSEPLAPAGGGQRESAQPQSAQTTGPADGDPPPVASGQEPGLYEDVRGGYVPGPVGGLSTGAYESAGTRQHSQVRVVRSHEPAGSESRGVRSALAHAAESLCAADPWPGYLQRATATR